MKNVIYAIVFSLFSLQVQAATISWDKAASSIMSTGFKSQDTDPFKQKLSGGVDFEAVQGPVTDTWAFTVADAGAGIDVSSLIIEFTNAQMDVSSITLDGTNYTADNGIVNLWSTNASLTNGTHLIVLNGIEVFNEIAQYDLKVSINEAPVPAAAWLFGSALLGLAGVSRRKSTSVAA